MAARITLEDLEKRFTPRRVRELFTDDGSNTPNADRLAEALEEASRQGDAILRRVWKDEASLAALVTDDAAVRGAYCALAMAIGSEARPEWIRQGEGPYTKIADRARRVLKDITDAELRPKGEETAGENPMHRARIVAPDPQFEFAPVKGKPQTGGF